jgi:rhodanese-related sulfurtransferase/glyoxylase-like metal-dependent hydrolase (beta-lactamase superfamily II)
MKPQVSGRLSIALILIFIAVIATSIRSNGITNLKDTINKFETIRAYIQAWLSEVDTHKPIISSSYLKQTIVDDWSNQMDKYQIVSVRKPDDYNNAGHIQYATNIYWIDIINDDSLARMSSDKTLILYCYYGHGSMISYTILSLLGYECHSLDFGMMAWNLDALVKEPWDRKADYDVEVHVNESKESYLLPVIASSQSDTKNIIKELASKYLSGEGSPVILPSDVKTIIDNWNSKKVEYQVVDVRTKIEFETGHIPHSINIPLAKIAEINNLKKLDPKRTIIIYSENGQMGQLGTTVLNLLGYNAVNIKFGMMDWNKAYVDRSKQWDGSARYPVEYGNVTGTGVNYMGTQMKSTDSPPVPAKQNDVEKAEITTTHLSGSIYLFEREGLNMVASIGDDGILLIDTHFKRSYSLLAEAIKRIKDVSIKFVINTHYHPDHVDGNENFAKSSVIIAHTNTRELLQQKVKTYDGMEFTPLRKEGLPIITFENELNIYFNNEKIKLKYYSKGHTDNDVVIFFPRSKVVVMGDIFRHQCLPYLDITGGGSVLGLISNLEKLLNEIPDDWTIVPGHGPVANKTDLQNYYQRFIDAVSHIQKQLDQGKSLDDVKQAGLPEFYKSYPPSAVEIEMWIEIVYRNLKGEI